MAPPKKIKDYDEDIEECNEDFTKYTTPKKNLSKTLVRKMYAKIETFLWNAEEDKAFNTIKDAILTNAVAGPNLNL